ncbi:hypothetical protein [Stenotrophomonas maltophilia]|uniref:hypothetical protein n=1 Tax=Stenotrophomonas maltophilia TaxID=40324 RepID=UPI003BF7F97C
MNDYNQEEKGTPTAEDLEVIREAIEKVRAGAVRAQKRQVLMFLSMMVPFACLAWWTASISNAIAPINQTLNGPKGHPERGLIMGVNFINGYRDSNGNYVEGSLDRVSRKLDEVRDEKR